eukprot:scaffold58225_cov57-Phaeocystis_antarctica.AAC.1
MAAGLCSWARCTRAYSKGKRRRAAQLAGTALVSRRVHLLFSARGVGALALAVDDTVHLVASVRLVRGRGKVRETGAATVRPREE